MGRDNIILHHCSKRKTYEKADLVERILFRIRDGDEHNYTADLRIYSLHEISPLMKSAGFTDIESFSMTKDDPVTVDSQLM